MASRKPPDSVPPSLTPHGAIELLRQRIGELDRIKTLPSDDPRISKWASTTGAILNSAFGKPNGAPHDMTKEFTHYHGEVFMNMPPAFHEQGHRKDLLHKKAVLESCIEQLEILAPPAAQVAVGHYQFQHEAKTRTFDPYWSRAPHGPGMSASILQMTGAD